MSNKYQVGSVAFSMVYQTHVRIAGAFYFHGSKTHVYRFLIKDQAYVAAEDQLLPVIDANELLKDVL